MANYSRIKESTRRRAADIVAALEAEIAARKQAQLDSFSMERSLSCVLTLKESDLPRFRLAEALISSSPSPAVPSLTLRNGRCHQQEWCRMATDNDLRLMELALGRPPLTKYSGTDWQEHAAALHSAVETHLQAGRRVLLLSPSPDESGQSEHAGAGVEALLRKYAQFVENQTQAASVIHLLPQYGDSQVAGALGLSLALSSAQSAWKAQRRTLDTAEADLQKTARGIAALLTGRQALSEEIADLNVIHQRCDQLLSYSQSISVHIKELEAQSQQIACFNSKASSTWRRWRQCLLGAQPASPEAVTNELEQARKRRGKVDQEADQLALEMVSRQAFIADTTRQLLKRLRHFAPTFAQAALLLVQHKHRLAEFKVAMEQSPAPPTATDVIKAAKLVCTTTDHLFEPILVGEQFDVVAIVQADQLCALTLYWSASLAKTALILSTNGDRRQLYPESGHESARFWLGPAGLWETPVAACGTKAGWAPVGRSPVELPPRG